MALVSTSVALSSVASVIVASSRLAGATLYDPVPVAIFNPSAQACYWGGGDMTTANLGIIIGSSATANMQLLAGDPVSGITTGGAVTVQVVIGRQKGSAV